MDIPIELLVLLAVIFCIGFFMLFMYFNKQIKLRRYKPENDKGRQAEEARRREGRIGEPIGVLQTKPIIPEQSLRDATNNKFVSKIGGSERKTSTSHGRAKHPFFRRR